MTPVNYFLSGYLVTGAIGGWADLDEEYWPDDWNPPLENYEDYLRGYIVAFAQSRFDSFHPEAQEKTKAAVRWILSLPPSHAKDWLNSSMVGIPVPDPATLLWEWVWEDLFGDEPWAVPGETFEVYSDTNETSYAKAEDWPNRPRPDSTPADAQPDPRLTRKWFRRR